MEGWLQVPSGERNLIGRAGWKLRYIRFSNNFATSRTPTSSTAPVPRPTTSGSINGASSASKTGLERSHSTHQVSSLGPAAVDVSGDPGKQWTLAVYKQKNDAEPVARYSIQKIASCYIGDVAANKKKSLVLPTLIVNLRAPDLPPHHSTPPSSRTFRRRSHEAPSKDASGKGGSGNITTLLFRPSAEEPHSLERWVKEIQSRLLPNSITVRTNTVDSTVREGFQMNDYDTLTPSPSSLFFMNGEPNTALLSPSIRSKASNLSSIDSDDISSLMSSSTSEAAVTPRTAEELRPQSAIDRVRPQLHLRSSRKGSGGLSVRGSEPTGSAPGRRETILDRFFSTAPSSPASDLQQGSKQMSSMARFEALMNQLEAERDSNAAISEYPVAPPPPTSVMTSDRPRRIPSPTQRAIEFVSTGQRRSPSPPKEPAPTYITTSMAPSDDSDNLSLHTTYTSSTAASIMMEAPAMALVPAGSQGKRHSLADFSLMRLATPPIFGITGASGGGGGAARRGSYGDLAQLPEVGAEPGATEADYPESGVRVGPGHLRVNRPLFREFSF